MDYFSPPEPGPYFSKSYGAAPATPVGGGEVLELKSMLHEMNNVHREELRSLRREIRHVGDRTPSPDHRSARYHRSADDDLCGGAVLHSRCTGGPFCS